MKIQKKTKIKIQFLQNTPLILFVFFFILFGLAADRFLEAQNLVNVIKQASYIGIAAIGMTLVLLTAGIDLSVGSTMYFATVVAGLLIRDMNWPLWLAFFCALLCGSAVGLLNGFLVTRLKILPFIVTLSTMVAVRGAGLLLTQSRAINFPDTVFKIGSFSVFGVLPVPIVLFMLVIVIVHIFLKKTQMGRQLYAIGFSLENAEKAGIPTKRVQMLAYTFCSTLAALAGCISIAQMGIVNAGFGQGDEFDAIAAAVLGGVSLFGGIGSVFPGAVLGAIFIQMVSTGLVFLQVDLYLQPLITAAIIFLAVFLDSFRTRLLTRINRRPIRVEEVQATNQSAC